MKVIRPNCRTQFTPADYDFIASVLPSLDAPTSGIIRLVRDPEILDLVLDQPSLFRAVLDLRSCLRVSLRFYFYVLVRHVLLREEIHDRDVADYVAEVLAEFSLLQRMRNPDPEDGRHLDYLHEMLEALERMEEEERFAMQTHIGNYALVMAGIFPGRLQRRVERRAAPGFRFYEELGAAHFRMAGNHYLARRMDMVSVLMTLGQAFHVTRLALNHLSEKLVFMETDRAVRDLFQELERPDERKNGEVD
ncbi:MAG: hypothetical protein JWP91_3927 [Fibrobacteres bacterium]|nr:hypothetical protein [Fibrobacterota bacterium]